MDWSKLRLNHNRVNSGRPIPVRPWFLMEWRCKAVDLTLVACLEGGETRLDWTFKH